MTLPARREYVVLGDAETETAEDDEQLHRKDEQIADAANDAQRRPGSPQPASSAAPEPAPTERPSAPHALDAGDDEDDVDSPSASADDDDGDGFHLPMAPQSIPSSPTASSFTSSPVSTFLRHPLSTLRQQLNRYYVVLLFAILAISCAGTLLRLLPDTPPLLKAFWRLFFMSCLLSLGFVYQWRQADDALVARFLSNDALLTVLVSGLAASAHFACWIWSLNHTSLAHALFFVSAYPLVVVAFMLARGRTVDWREAAGVLLGLVGSALLLLDASSDDSAVSASDGVENSGPVPVSFIGDFVAFMGAVTFVVYLYAGQRVRSWMPLFLYTFPMTLLSSLPVLLLSLAVEGSTFYGFTASSVFGFLAPSSLLILVLIAVLPGGIGHTGVNYCVRRVSPLSISVVLNLEPVLGIVIGVAAGVDALPGLLTAIGGPISMIGCFLAIVGTWHREHREKEEAEAQRAEDSAAAGTEGGLTAAAHEDGQRQDAAVADADSDAEDTRELEMTEGAEKKTELEVIVAEARAAGKRGAEEEELLRRADDEALHEAMHDSSEPAASAAAASPAPQHQAEA